MCLFCAKPWAWGFQGHQEEGEPCPAQMAPEGRVAGAADLVKNSEAPNKLVKMTN